MLLVSTFRQEPILDPEHPYHHENLKEALLEAAIALIGEVGPHAFTLREVARRAGVSHNAPYRHFRDKDALLAAVATQGFQRLTDALREAASRGRTALERWKRSGRAYIAFAVRWPQHFTVMFDAAFIASDYPECAAAGKAAFDILLRLVADAQAAGELDGREPLPLALTSWALVHGLAKLAVSRRLPFEPARAVEFFDAFAAGVLERGMSPRSKMTRRPSR